MNGLPKSKEFEYSNPVLITVAWQVFGLIEKSEKIYFAQLNECLLLNQNSRNK